MTHSGLWPILDFGFSVFLINTEFWIFRISFLSEFCLFTVFRLFGFSAFGILVFGISARSEFWLILYFDFSGFWLIWDLSFLVFVSFGFLSLRNFAFSIFSAFKNFDFRIMTFGILTATGIKHIAVSIRIINIGLRQRKPSHNKYIFSELNVSLSHLTNLDLIRSVVLNILLFYGIP